MPSSLLNHLARAAVKHGVKFLLNLVPGGQAVYEIANDTFEEYRRECREADLRSEVVALAQSSPAQIRSDAEVAAAQAATNQPAEVRAALTAYLSQVPGAIRRSLRRPTDPTGTTAPPQFVIQAPENLAQILPARPPRFKPGDRPLPGVDWVLEELVGMGGFGEVWKAKHPHLKSVAPAALKFCLDPAAAPALRNEAGVLDRVMQHGRHPGIVPLIQTYLDADPPCIAYEFVEGGDLGGLIQELHARGKCDATMAHRLLMRLADIVAFAHQAQPAIVHGDLKPANVLVRRGSDRKFTLRVTDFGIGGLAAALAVRDSRQPTRSRQELMTEAVRGAYTPLYASPEQIARRRGEPADPRDDVHALGVIWYQLLTGELGLMSIPPDWREQVEGSVPDQQLLRLLASCIASKAEKRPVSAAALAAELRKLLTDEEIVLIPEDPPSRPGPPPLPAGALPSADAVDADWAELLRQTERGCEERFIRDQGPRRIKAWRSAAEKGRFAAQAMIAACYQYGAGVERDLEEAVRWLHKAAQHGHPAVQLALGMTHYEGMGVDRDVDEGIKWIRKAAAQEFPIAEMLLGVIYTEQLHDEDEGAKWLRRGLPWCRAAADQDNPLAQFLMGQVHLKGQGVDKNVAAALKWLHKAAASDCASAQFALGQLHLAGEIVAKDHGAALDWFRRAADQDSAAGQNQLGLMYLEGHGVKQDAAQSLPWFQRAAEQGDAAAQFNLAWAFQEGLGTRQDKGEALRWYRRSAKQGFAPAQTNLGVMYWNGDAVPHDDAEAARWFRKAAEQGQGPGQGMLGLAHLHGRGVAQDDDMAATWFRKAAAQGNAEAQNMLGVLHEVGRGVPQSNDEAIAWYRKAAEQGVGAAKQALQRLAPSFWKRLLG